MCGEEKILENESVQSFYDENTGNASLILFDLTTIENQPIIYSVHTENEFGRAISKTEVIIEANEAIVQKTMKAPRVTSLIAKTIKYHDTLTLNSMFSGSPEPEIKWLKNGKPIDASEDDNVTINIENNVTHLIITDVDRKRTGKYEIVAVNEVGESRASCSIMISDDSMTEELLVPQFIETIKPKTVLANEIVILEAIVKSFPQSSFQWFFNSKPVEQTKSIRIHSIDNKSILIIDSFTYENDGLYTCRAENVAGSVTSSATIKLVETEKQLEEIHEYMSPRFIHKLKPLQLMDGDALKLTCHVIGNPIPKIQWLRDKTELTENRGTQIIQDSFGNCELKISEIFVEDAGIYVCKAINKFGKATTKAKIVIEGIIIKHIQFFVCICCCIDVRIVHCRYIVFTELVVFVVSSLLVSYFIVQELNKKSRFTHLSIAFICYYDKLIIFMKQNLSFTLAML